MEENEIKYGGLIFTEKHKEDFPICMSFENNEAIKIPDSYAVSYLPPTENQGSTGNCVAQTLAQIMEIIYHNNFLEHKDFSVGFIYGNRNPDEWQGYGMDGYMACGHLCKDGDVFRSTYESYHEVPSIIYEVDNVKDDLKNFAIKPAYYVRTNDWESVKKHIMRYNIPVFGSVECSDFTRQSGGHAMALYGWKNKNTALFHNSWGIHNRIVELDASKVREFWLIIPWDNPIFLDLNSNHWAYDILTHAAVDKILLGYPNKTIRPNAPITRAEFCAMLYREEKLGLI